MRVKLIVVHTERGGGPRTYVLDQDTIVIGRAGTCDLPLDDPDRVVSKQHAALRVEGDVLRIADLGSKNHTFLNGERVGTEPRAVRDGDQVQLGPFQVTVALERDVMVADDLDRTVFGAAFANPLADPAEAVAAALGGLRQAFQQVDYRDRADALKMALRDALGPQADLRGILPLVDPDAALAEPGPAPPASAPPSAEPPQVPTDTPKEDLDDLFGPPLDVDGDGDLDDLFGPPLGEGGDASSDPFAAPVGGDPFASPPSSTSPPAEAPSPAAGPSGPDDLHRALAGVVVRLISMPGKFRHEFLGHTVIHAPETALLFDADEGALLRHLTTDDPGLRAQRLGLLADATEAVLQHHQSLLEGYRAAAREGAAVLVNGLDPDQLEGQVKAGPLPGAKERALVDLIRQRCEMMRGEDFAAAERRVYRPIFSRAYLDTLAHARAAAASDS